MPSPSQGVWHLGPFPLRAYALCIIAGVMAAIWLAERRWTSRGGEPGVISDVALWVVPFGIVGGRLYHVATDPQLYFADGQNPWNAFAVWRGGLGIWGAVALGAVGAYIGARRAGVSFSDLAWAIAPAVPLGQAIGRWGNWFNQELFGKATDLPWGLRIDADKIPAGYAPGTTFHPTFLYESLWNFALCIVLLRIDRKFTLRPGRLFAMYVVGYSIGRFWVEALRIDPAHLAGGLRLNQWVALIVGAIALVYLLVDWQQHRGEVAELLDEPEPEVEEQYLRESLD